MPSVLLATADGAPDCSWSGQIKSAFTKLGWNVEVFNYRMFQMHRIQFGRSLISSALIKKSLRVNPDLLLVTKGEGIVKDTIKKIKEMLPNIKTANWCLDEPFGDAMQFNKVLTIPEYDKFFIFDSGYSKRIEDMGGRPHWLPCSSDPDVFSEQIQWNDRRWICDCSFIGSHNSHRENILKDVAELDLKVWGYRWDTVDKYSLLRQRVQKDFPKADKKLDDVFWMSRLQNLTRSNINIHNPQTIHDGANLRVFDLMANKSFQLCDGINGISSVLTPGKDCVMYSNTSELKRLVSYYSESGEERQKIVEHAHKTFLEKHTTSHRIKEILASLDFSS